MWVVLNIANSRFETPSSVDYCETEEQANALCDYLENKYGGCSDFVFAVVKARKWDELPVPYDPYSSILRVEMNADGSFKEEWSEKNKRYSDDLKLPEDERFLEDTWNYPQEAVDALKEKGLHVSVNKPYQYGTNPPGISIFIYSDVALDDEQLEILVRPYAEEAKKTLQEQYEVVDLPPRPAPPTKGWKVKENA